MSWVAHAAPRARSSAAIDGEQAVEQVEPAVNVADRIDADPVRHAVAAAAGVAGDEIEQGFDGHDFANAILSGRARQIGRARRDFNRGAACGPPS